MHPQHAVIRTAGGAETAATLQKRLPATVLADDGDVSRQLVKAGQFVLAYEHAVELGTDRAPIALELRRPREHRIVVDRRIADLAAFEIEPFGESHHGHERPRDQGGPLERLDAGGAEILGEILGGFGGLLCYAQPAVPSRENAPMTL
jgi:hypothetical protein